MQQRAADHQPVDARLELRTDVSREPLRVGIGNAFIHELELPAYRQAVGETPRIAKRCGSGRPLVGAAQKDVPEGRRFRSPLNAAGIQAVEPQPDCPPEQLNRGGQVILREPQIVVYLLTAGGNSERLEASGSRRIPEP